jgi:hypothetical protein
VDRDFPEHFHDSFSSRMASDRTGEVTELLNAAGTGDPRALDRVLPLVYAELRQLAENVFRSERT